MIKTCSFLFLYLLFIPTGQAQIFKTSVSILGNKNNGPYHFIENEGDFNTKKNSFNLGLAVNVACYPLKSQKWFVATGLRLNTTEAWLAAQNTVPGVSSASDALDWNFRWRAVTIPLHLGRTFVPFKNSKFYIDLYAGASFGIIQTSMVGSGSALQKSNDDHELIGAGMGSLRDNDGFATRPLTTLDAGFRFNPIPQWPKLSIGFFFAYNLKETNNMKRGGFISNETQGIHKDYYFNMTRRFNNYTFTVSYAFGRKWKNSIVGKKALTSNRKRKMDCPTGI